MHRRSGPADIEPDGAVGFDSKAVPARVHDRVGPVEGRAAGHPRDDVAVTKWRHRTGQDVDRDAVRRERLGADADRGPARRARDANGDGRAGERQRRHRDHQRGKRAPWSAGQLRSSLRAIRGREGTSVDGAVVASLGPDGHRSIPAGRPTDSVAPARQASRGTCPAVMGSASRSPAGRPGPASSAARPPNIGQDDPRRRSRAPHRVLTDRPRPRPRTGPASLGATNEPRDHASVLVAMTLVRPVPAPTAPQRRDRHA